MQQLIFFIQRFKYFLFFILLESIAISLIFTNLNFQKSKFVQLECPVHHNNKGAPESEHYINYMANSNFKVFDIDTIFFNNKLMVLDFLFVNILLPKASSLESQTLIYNKL